MDFTGDLSSQGKKNMITTEPPMITTPQNLASNKKKPPANTRAIAAQAPFTFRSLVFRANIPRMTAKKIHKGNKKFVVVARNIE